MTTYESHAAPAPSAFPIRVLRQHPVVALMVLVFVFEWMIMLPEVADELGLLPFHIPGILGILLGWAPGLAAMIITGATSRMAGIKALLRGYLVWRVSLPWYLLALFGTAAFILGGIRLHIMLGGTAPTLPLASVPVMNIVLDFLIFLVFGFVFNTEDMAWRGVALPLLQSRYSALVASLIIGVPEGLTHLPYFFVPGDFRQQVGFFWFMAFTIAMVIIMTWVFNSTGGSLLIVVLFHAAQNAWANLLDTTPAPGPNDLRPFILAVGLMWVVALAVIALYGQRLLSRVGGPTSSPAIAESMDGRELRHE